MTDWPTIPVPRIDVIFVEADLEEVAGRLRGESASAARSDGRPDYEVTGDAAGIEFDFGPDSSLLPDQPWLAERYPLRGFRRVSQVASNPKFCMVEAFVNQNWPYFDEALHQWTNSRVIGIYSNIDKNPMLDAPIFIADQYAYPENGMTVWSASGKKRWVHAGRSDGRWSFYNEGEPLAFEDISHYSQRKKADRLNRSILFDYLEALGIDPIATFRDRQLINPHLYSSDHIGQETSIYESERLRYRQWLSDNNLSLPDDSMDVSRTED